MEQGESLENVQQPSRLPEAPPPFDGANRQPRTDSADVVREKIAVRPDGSVVIDHSGRDKRPAEGGGARVLRQDSAISVDEFSMETYSMDSPMCLSSRDAAAVNGVPADGAGATSPLHVGASSPFKVSDLGGEPARGRSASQGAAKRKSSHRVVTAPRMGHAFMQHVECLSLDVTEPYPNQVGGSRVIVRGREDGTVLKPVSGREIWFYEMVGKGAIATFTPAYRGARRDQGDEEGHSCLAILEDLTSGYECPCVLDVKMGVCTAAPDRTEEKRVRCEEKDKVTTTGSIGARVCGLRAYQVMMMMILMIMIELVIRVYISFTLEIHEHYDWRVCGLRSYQVCPSSR